jgi:arabinogalactan endo-1,4-beta-galactosidase
MRTFLVRNCVLLGSAAALIGGIMTAGGAAAAVPARTTAAATTATTATTLPLLPDGLNVAIGAHATANSGSAPSTSLGNIDDGDGTTRWCPSTLGIHTVTLDLGHVVDVTGTGATFSGEEGSDGSFYSISTGITRPDQTPFPNQAPDSRNGIVQGPLYLFAGTASNVTATVPARYVTLTYQVPREQNICVQELRVFSTDAQAAPHLELGDDLSGLTADTGTYTVNGQSSPLLSIVKSGGTNYARLRLLVNPTDCGTTCLDLANELAIASQVTKAGMKILLDIEYSDSPTSSTAQATPAAWAGQSLPDLSATVRSYTESVIKSFARNGTPVSQVAIGNEITQGFLWPAGQLVPGPSGPSDWTALTTLLKAGIQGARAGNPAGNPLQVQLDIDAGADTATSADFFQHMTDAGVPFDVIGESYSPWLQGSLSDLKTNLLSLTSRFRKPVVLAEGQFPYADVTGYGSYSTTVPYPDTLPGYLITPAGQASYERDLVSLLASLPHGLGLGLFYLSPDTEGSLGEFTPAGAAEPAVDAYRVGSQATSYGAGAQPVGTVPPGTPAPGPAQAATTGSAALPGTLPPLPSGLNVAIGAPVTANSGSVPGNSLSNVVDGDGTTRWCPSTLGVHKVTIDLGHVTDVTGTGITFSGEQTGDGATYTVSTGITRPDQSAFPNQAAADSNGITQGALYLFSGTSSNVAATVPARYLTLTYQVPREENICVQEFRVFAAASAQQSGRLELGSDLSTLISDTGTYTLAGQSMPILNIFSSGGLNYVRLRLWVNPVSGFFGVPSEPPGCSAASCPDLANDLTMATEAKAAGMKVLLDIHYSDTWADPQHQNVPAAWAGETLSQLAASMQDYTQSVIQAFAANGTPVSQVAIGNEITEGMAWQFTTLAAAAGAITPAGTTTIGVADASGIGAGDTLYIDSLATSSSVAGVADPSTDIVKVASVGTPTASGTPVTLTSPLRFAHVGPVSVQDVQDSGHLLFNDATGQADWTSLTTLLKAAIQGARDGNPAGNPLLIQLHIDRGGDNAAATDFVSHMVAAGVHFDVIGLSYYPWYHGPMSAMKANLTALIDRFHKYVMISEDQFPQNPQGGYGDYNPADANYPDTLPGYLVTPAGQASYQRDLVSLMASLPDGRGLGVFYWDGDSTGTLGMFARGGVAQPVIDANQIGATPTAVSSRMAR